MRFSVAVVLLPLRAAQIKSTRDMLGELKAA